MIYVLTFVHGTSITVQSVHVTIHRFFKLYQKTTCSGVPRHKFSGGVSSPQTGQNLEGQ